MSKVQILPITIEAALEVASNLLPEDRREIEEGWGCDVKEELLTAAQDSSTVYFTMPNGKTAGIGGVQQDGNIWMLCTPAIYYYPIAFIKAAKGYLESRKEPLLWNVVDARNKLHLKLLKSLGFKFLRKISHGPNQLSFIEFARVRRKRSERRS